MTDAPDRRVCLFTGAGGRLGAAFCAAHSRDYDIVAVYRTRHPPVASQEQSFVDPLDPLRPVPTDGRPVFAVRADLTAPGAVDRVVELAMARFGHVDVLVNAAARYDFGALLMGDRVLDSAPDHLALNLLVPAHLARAVARACWRDRPDENRASRRNVVNLSSTSALHAFGGGQGMYSASKAALNALTRHMALEYATVGIRVNALAPTSFPGLIPTEAVVEGIRRLDAGEETGRLLVLDTDGERTL